MNLLRGHLVGQNPSVVQQLKSLVGNEVFPAVRRKLHVEITGVAQAFEAGVQAGEKLGERGTGEPEKSQRLGPATPLHQSELAVLADALEAQHQLSQRQLRFGGGQTRGACFLRPCLARRYGRKSGWNGSGGSRQWGYIART